jgi:hypothetical protein
LRRLRATGLIPPPFKIGKRAHRTWSDVYDEALAALPAALAALTPVIPERPAESPAVPIRAAKPEAAPRKRGPGRPRKADSELRHPRRAPRKPHPAEVAAE